MGGIMKAQRAQLWIALVGLALGAFILHYRIHPPQQGLTYFWASLFPGVDLVVVSILFLFRSTVIWALLLNTFLAYLGIILMSDLTITWTLTGAIKVSPSTQPFAWLLQTLLPDIMILIADLFVGMALYKITVSAPKENT
jgi:hypothetical protein